MSRRVRIEPQRPKRVVEQRGSLTFDSYLCCGHGWCDVKDGDAVNQFCQDCGATCRRDDKGTIVEYDRDADFLNAKKGPSNPATSVV